MSGKDSIILEKRKVGNTSLFPIALNIDEDSYTVHIKMERENPTGSMKDRTAFALIQQLEDQGRLNNDSVVIESTSGNLGVALAYQCSMRGYRFIAVIDPKTTQENIARMEAYGACIEMVHTPDENDGFLLSRLARVQALCESHQSYIWTNQYSNPANPFIHYSMTGPEIYEQMHKQVNVIFIPVSTGGTLAGIGRFFREVSPSTHIVAIDAYGSTIFGGPSAPRKLTGIGASRPSSFLDQHLYDTHLLIKDQEAFAFCHAFFSATQIKIGGSSGAVLAGCIRYLQRFPSLKHIVAICADKGEHYNSTIFNPDWMQHPHFAIPTITLAPIVSGHRV